MNEFVYHVIFVIGIYYQSPAVSMTQLGHLFKMNAALSPGKSGVFFAGDEDVDHITQPNNTMTCRVLSIPA